MQNAYNNSNVLFYKNQEILGLDWLFLQIFTKFKTDYFVFNLMEKLIRAWQKLVNRKLLSVVKAAKTQQKVLVKKEQPYS